MAPRKATATPPAAKKTPAPRAKKPLPDPENVVPFKRGAGRAVGTRSTGSKTSPKALNVAERRARAVALRRAGVSFVKIAEQIREAVDDKGRKLFAVDEKYDYRRAHEDVREATDRYVSAAVAEYRDESLARLDYALMNVVPRLSGEHWRTAVEALVKLETRRARLLGLDADQRFQVTGADGGPIVLSVPVTDPEVSYDAALAAVNEILGPPKEISG